MKWLVYVSMIVMLCAPQALWAGPGDKVYFADEDLKACVIDALAGLDPPIITTEPTEADMEKLVTLEASGKDIGSLEGLQKINNTVLFRTNNL